MRLSEILDKALVEGASYDSSQVTHKLRLFLVERGWPVTVANAVSIRNDNGTYTVYYPEKWSRQVNDIEYGTESTPPNPAIRAFLTGGIGTKSFADGISYSLKSSGVI